MAIPDQSLRQGIEAARAGEVAKAHMILTKVTQREPHNEKAWLWLSSVVETDEERITCLENVLAIHPDHQAAQYGLAALKQKMVSLETLPAQPQPQPEKTRTYAAITFLVLGMLIIMTLWCSGKWGPVFGTGSKIGITPTAIRPSIGEKGILHVDKGASILVAVDQETFDKLLDAVHAKDDYGKMDLLLSEQVFSVKNNTGVLVIDEGLFTTKVRILEGPYTGQSGWVPSEWVLIK